MAKVKVFKLTPENSEEISNFMGSVKLLQEGIIVSEGNVAFLYRDKEEYGMDKADMLAAASQELSKAQKQYVLQDGLVRAYDKLIANAKEFVKGKEVKKDEAKAALDAYKGTYDGAALEEEISAADKEIEAAKKAKNKPLAKELITKRNEIFTKLDTYRKEFDKKGEELTKAYNEAAIDHANSTGEIKENDGLREQAVKDRAHAEVFINTSKELIAEIESGNMNV